jgi:hypothetical protein
LLFWPGSNISGWMALNILKMIVHPFWSFVNLGCDISWNAPKINNSFVFMPFYGGNLVIPIFFLRSMSHLWFLVLSTTWSHRPCLCLQSWYFCAG